MTEPTAAASAPGDYRLLLPDGWFRLPLEPRERERSADALVERRFQGIDNAPHVKEELRKDLRAHTAKAFRRGGIELYLSLQPVGPFTIPARSLPLCSSPSHHCGTRRS